MATLSKLPNGMSHTQFAADLLRISKLGTAGPAEKKAIIEKFPKTLGCMYDGKQTTVKELLLSTTVESTALIQTEMKNVFIEGAEPFKQARNAIKTIPMAAKSMQLLVGETGTYAPEVAEGAEIPIDIQNYTTVTLTARKFAVRPVITKEMIDDSLFDVAAMEVAKAGARLENRLNREVVDEFLNTLAATAGYNTDCGGSGATPLTFLENASATIKNAGYLPDRVLAHPSCFAAFRTAGIGLNYDLGLVNKAEGAPFHGLSWYETGVADNAATYVWGWGTNDYRGAVVFDSNAAQVIGMRQDIEVEDFDDPIRQIRSFSASMRYDVECVSASAANLIQY